MNQDIKPKMKIDTKRAGGRPRKDRCDQRRHHHKVSYDDLEESIIQMKAEEYNSNDSKYLHDIGLTGTVNAPLSAEATEQLRDICGLANNTNQIAHEAHIAGLKSLQKDAQRVVNLLGTLIHRILTGGNLFDTIHSTTRI